MRVGVPIVLAAALVAGPAAAHVDQARLKTTAVMPLRVAGTGFRPRERIIVRVVQFGTKWTRAAVASTRGSFVVAFPGSLDACAGGASVKAVGASGDAAVLKLGAERMCPPQSP
jgi:hypothetical protein